MNGLSVVKESVSDNYLVLYNGWHDVIAEIYVTKLKYQTLYVLQSLYSLTHLLAYIRGQSVARSILLSYMIITNQCEHTVIGARTYDESIWLTVYMYIQGGPKTGPF